ncbi:hypothetical protein ACWELJ_05040 [Nocardia sp. NPDC004582]
MDHPKLPDGRLTLRHDRIEATSFLTVRQLLLETDFVAVLPSLIGHSVGITIAAGRALGPSARALIDNLEWTAAGGLDPHAGPREARSGALWPQP